MPKLQRSLSTVCFCGLLLAGEGGTVTGIVLDEHGKPVSRARVCFDDMKPHGTHWPMARLTDADGRFAASDVPFGTYTVYALKDNDGYPDPSLDFYNTQDRTQIALSPSGPTAYVVVTMNRKAGRLARMSITDALTGLSVESARVTLSRGAAYAGGSDDMPLPSLVPIDITVRAPGYVDWYYPGTADPARRTAITVQPGESINLDVVLQPARKQ